MTDAAPVDPAVEAETAELAHDTAGLPDFRRMPVPVAIAWLGEHGEPADPRSDIDTVSLERRFPHLRGVTARDLDLDGPHGRVPVRVYTSPDAQSSPVGLVWVHGGAFLGGHLEMPESNWVARELAARGIPVAAVDYTKCLRGVHYPVPSDDVLAAWRAVTDAAGSLLGAETVALGGASAGGTLVAGAVVRLRDGGEALPARLVLVYPVLHPDPTRASGEVDPDSPHGHLQRNYAGSEEALADPTVYAGLDDGHGFPPTLVVVCEGDDLRPSGEAFAATLGRAGNPVELHLEPGAPHGHIDHPGDPAALRTIDRIATWLTS